MNKFTTEMMKDRMIRTGTFSINGYIFSKVAPHKDGIRARSESNVSCYLSSRDLEIVMETANIRF